jgi:hypothetical protein
VWRETHRHELQSFNEPDIVKYIKVNRLGWAGHVIHMDNNRTVKVYNTKPAGIRNTGRPKLRWEDDGMQDVKTLGMKSWREEEAGRSF